jgi:hypothetical protein
VPAAPDPVPAVSETPARITEKPLRAKPAKIARKYRVPWADLLQKVFAIDVLACPDCNGRMQLIAFITQATVAKAKRILDHLGLESTGPPVARAAPPPEQVDLGPSYGAADPIYPE